MPSRMDVYAVGAYGYRNFGDDCYAAVLRGKLAAVWADSKIDFHGMDASPFSPDRHRAVVLGGGGLFCRYVAECGTDNLAYFLRYPAVMHLFEKKSYALALGVQGPFAGQGLERLLPIIDQMALRTVRDTESARLLRAAGVRSPIQTCADLAYLLPAPARFQNSRKRKPVLGIVASQPDKNVVYPESLGFQRRITEAIATLERDFELRYISFAHHADGWLPSSIVYDPDQPSAIENFLAEFRQIDVCLISRFHGVILSVLNEIPFVAIGAPGEKVERECAALSHPFFLPYSSDAEEFSSAIRNVWAERETVEMQLSVKRPRRVKLAERNIELLHAAEAAVSEKQITKTQSPHDTLVIWAAEDEFWDEARFNLEAFGPFDCLVPATSQLRSQHVKRRFALPAGTLMHWAMMPNEIKNEIKKHYGNVVLCHASSRTAPSHLVELGKECGSDVREYALWRNQCN